MYLAGRADCAPAHRMVMGRLVAAGLGMECCPKMKIAGDGVVGQPRSSHCDMLSPTH